MARIWLDGIRKPPVGYIWCKSVDKAKYMITMIERRAELYHKPEDIIELIDCDHDLGDFRDKGGDGIKLLDWLAETKRFYPIRLHTQNPVGLENMRRLIDRHWPK